MEESKPENRLYMKSAAILCTTSFRVKNLITYPRKKDLLFYCMKYMIENKPAAIHAHLVSIFHGILTISITLYWQK